jgi:hypothetical protein
MEDKLENGVSGFEYEIIQNGYDNEFNIIKPNKELLSIVDEISYFDFLDVVVKSRKLEKSLNESRKFLNKKFILHYIYFDSLENINNNIVYYNPQSEEELIKLYNSLGTLIDPYDINININENITYTRGGSINLLGLGCLNRDNISKMKPIFGYMDLPFVLSEFTSSSITHEIVHSQLLSNRGIVKKISNREVLSIFLELLECFEHNKNDIYLKELLCRMREFNLYTDTLVEFYNNKRELDDEVINSTIYLESSLKSFSLLELYINSSFKIKKEILQGIQSIFNGDLQLESFLSKYNININSSYKAVRTDIDKILKKTR